MCYDGTNYWVFNAQHVGYDLWQFDSNFVFVDKYSQRAPLWVPAHILFGLTNARAASIGGSPYVYAASSGNNGIPISRSGIFPLENFTGSTGDVGDPPAGGFDLGQRKDIYGADLFGHQEHGEILDVYEVTNGTHTQNGVYAIVRWDDNSIGVGDGIIALLRIEEEPSRWAIRAAYTLSGTSTGFHTGNGGFDMLHMDT